MDEQTQCTQRGCIVSLTRVKQYVNPGDARQNVSSKTNSATIVSCLMFCPCSPFGNQINLSKKSYRFLVAHIPRSGQPREFAEVQSE